MFKDPTPRELKTETVAAQAAFRLASEEMVITYDIPDYDHQRKDAEYLAMRVRDIYYSIYDQEREYHLCLEYHKMSVSLTREIYLVHIKRTHHTISPELIPIQ